MDARTLSLILVCALPVPGRGGAAGSDTPLNEPETDVRTFQVQGVVKKLASDGRTVVVAHEAVPTYMAAMTMPFKVKQPAELAGLQSGDQIQFRLKVSETESWIEGVSKVASGPAMGQASRLPTETPVPGPADSGDKYVPKRRNPLLDYPFTNELGQAVRLSDFRGQALAITFFFTRCPIPDYCPRLSRNFEEASQKLSAMAGGPTNWHFLSVTFDPEFDTPSVLRAYGERYQHDPKSWSFLTGPKAQIGELAGASDVKYEAASGFINHNFRTLIIDAAGHLQMVFPMGGNLSDAIVAEVLKAAAVTNRPPASNGREAQPQTAALAR
jgi:protein SCO1